MTSNPKTNGAGSRRSAGFLDADEVGRHWDLGPWQGWERTPSGSTNRSYFVTTDRGEFVARVSNPRKTERSLAAEVALLEHLRARGVPVPAVVATRSGTPWARVGDAFCLITERVPGGHADPTIPAHLGQAGRTLARFHRETLDLPEFARPEPASELPALAEGPAVLDRLEALAAELLDPGGLDRFRRAADGLRPWFGAVLSSLTGDALPEALTHGSLGRSAMLFDGERLVAVLDFERVAYEPRVLDLAYLLRSMTRNRGERGAFFTARFGALVGAYGDEDPLSPSERARIPAAMQAQGLLRVRSKAVNLLTKHETVPETAEDVLGLLDKPMELELARIRWLAAHEDELVAAVAG
ncbi:MAG TPA: phosphotransferase [Acidimicrobiia bacterium]|nr:phosphotransferase [Acidimicrobiia bacterium]